MVGGFAIPVALQPDLGTAMFLVLISGFVILFVVVKWSTLIVLASGAAKAPYLEPLRILIPFDFSFTLPEADSSA